MTAPSSDLVDGAAPAAQRRGDTTSTDEALAEVRRLLLDTEGLARAVAGGHRRNATVPWRRVELRYVDLAAGRRLQVTSYDDTQAHSRNLEPGSAADQAVDDLLSLPFGHWHVETNSETLQLRFTKKGRPLLHRTGRTVLVELDRGHDKPKRVRLEPSDPVLRLLDVSDADGRVKPRRRAKYRQVEDFLAALDPVVDEAVRRRTSPVDERHPLRLLDLGCGNAYLTFTAFRYLTSVRGMPVTAVGVDVKEQARERNTRIARDLDAAESLRFVRGTIAQADVDIAPDIVVALHACDTATDEALARAIRQRVPVVLAAPCCHHDIQRQLAGERAPGPSRLLLRHGILRERFGDVLTDALRASLLRLAGYRAEVVEFVDPEHTPRNTLIRAARTDAVPDEATVEAYAALTREWAVVPALARMLEGDVPALQRASPYPGG